MKRKSKLTIAIATAGLAVLGGAAVYAQDKYSLNSPSGIAFSDFRGYEDWAVVSSARTDEVLKVIVANPIMIDAQVPRRCARDGAVAIPKRNRRPQSHVRSRVVMGEPARLRLDSLQLELGRGLQCHTSILISSSARTSKTRAA